MTSELTARQRAQFAQHGVPVVLIDPMNVPDERVPSIGATNFSGGMAATEHLLKLGHRRIAMIEGRHDAVCNTARLHGYQAALSRAGITPDPLLIKRGAFRFEPAYQAALELFALDEPPTAVFTGNDLEAFGVIEAARRPRLAGTGGRQRRRLRRHGCGQHLGPAPDHRPPALRRDRPCRTPRPAPARRG